MAGIPPERRATGLRTRAPSEIGGTEGREVGGLLGCLFRGLRLLGDPHLAWGSPAQAACSRVHRHKVDVLYRLLLDRALTWFAAYFLLEHGLWRAHSTGGVPTPVAAPETHPVRNRTLNPVGDDTGPGGRRGR